MASREEREQAIKSASQQVKHGSVWLRRAIDVPPVATPRPVAPPPPKPGR